MTEKDKLYLAALLHDIGKFIERAKDKNWETDAYKYVRNKEVSKNYAHRRYSALFIEKYLSQKEFVKNNSNSIEELVIHHHNDNLNEVDNYLSIDQRGLLQKIIRIADDLASSEREVDETLDPEKYFLVNLESPFNNIKIKDELKNQLAVKSKKYLLPLELHIKKENQFPVNEKINTENKYPELVKNFLNEVSNIENDTALHSLMEKYLAQVPAQTPTEFDGKKHLNKPDLNLYDHSRTVAAIAVVLYEECVNGRYKKIKDSIETTGKKYVKQLEEISNPAILICGNVNGIQDFIFDVKSSRAAKSLKGRSYFIQLLTEVIAKYIIDKFDLKESNILYNGGGNFFILAPSYRKEYLSEIQKAIAANLIDTKLYISLGFSEVNFKDFENFGNIFDKAVKSSHDSKKQKFKELPINEVFNPFPQILKSEGGYDKLAEDLQKTTHYYIGKDYEDNLPRPAWEKIFRKFGYQVSLRPESFEQQGSLYNNTDFSKNYSSFRFAVKDVPKWTNSLITLVKKEKDDFSFEEGEANGSIIPWKRFAELAEIECSTSKIGVLKMDIDNLGKIFQGGIQKPTIGRVAYLSRSIKWFFEGYMNSLLQSEKFKDRIYPIFSGGDDFFVVGSWNKIFDFAFEVRNEFSEYVCQHPGITLSASLLIISESYPITQIARLAEERLEEAKNRRDVKTNAKIKNGVSVFDTVLSWDDFYEAKQLKDKIKNIIEWNNNNRAIINKIQKSSAGFAGIQREALFNKVIKFYKVWRLNYYLRDFANIRKNNPNKEKIESTVEEIVKQYENLFFEAFKGNQTSIQIFPVAARWAELETRNKLGDQ